MTRVESLGDRAEIERFLRRSAQAQLYALADLDEPFWPDTRWYASRDRGGEIDALCLVLEKLALPIVSAIAEPSHAPTLELLRALATRLPRVFFVNFPLGYQAALAESFVIARVGEYLKMELEGAAGLERFERPGIERLGPGDADELEAFYRTRAFGEGESLGFYARYMLEFPWFGLREAGELVAVAGVHVFSERYGVAAIGNVATSPARRGCGLARAVCARLARELASRVPLVGLNVAAKNAAARRCYEALGFCERLRYEEAVLTSRDTRSDKIRGR